MDEKEARDAQIQDLFERIEPLWVRLEIEQEYIDQFTERNVGSGLASIQAVSSGRRLIPFRILKNPLTSVRTRA